MTSSSLLISCACTVLCLIGETAEELSSHKIYMISTHSLEAQLWTVLSIPLELKQNMSRSFGNLI